MYVAEFELAWDRAVFLGDPDTVNLDPTFNRFDAEGNIVALPRFNELSASS